MDILKSLLPYTIKTCCTRKNMLIFITFVIVIITYYHRIINTPIIMHFRPVNNDISCHDVDEGDALPSAEDEDFSPEYDSIFFLETSCRGGLNSRQACAIESASRAHPRRQVYVMFSAPVSDDVYRRSCIAVLRRLPNVKFARVHITNYAEFTPLDDLIARKPFKKSKWRVEHTSDILRLLILYKWGGVYLDTDMLVVKSLTPLGNNWVAKEDEDSVSNGALAISMDVIGRNFIENLMDEVQVSFKPESWRNNGGGAITRVLGKICKTQNASEWSYSTCKGLDVYDPEYFYPLHYSNYQTYFDPGNFDYNRSAYTHHFWNMLTHNLKVKKDSPYANMARKFCPMIYKMYGEEFGS